MDQGNWLALLKWSLRQGGDGTTPSEQSQLTDEDRLFLERVMSESVKNEPARMQEIMNRLVNLLDTHALDENEEEVEGMLEELQDIVEQIDMAQIFVKYGGLECLLQIVERNDHESSLRTAASTVIGTLAQNNPQVQAEAHKVNVPGRLSELFVASTTSSKLQAKVLYALSCCVRNYPPAEESFVSEWGQRVMEVIFRSPVTATSPPTVRRGLYLCNSLFNSDNSVIARMSQEMFLPLLLATSATTTTTTATTSEPSSAPTSSSSSAASASASCCLDELIHHKDMDVREAVLALLTSLANSVTTASSIVWGREYLLSNHHQEVLFTALRQRADQLSSLLTKLDRKSNEKKGNNSNNNNSGGGGGAAAALDEEDGYESSDAEILLQEQNMITGLLTSLQQPPPPISAPTTASTTKMLMLK